jgi:hypothetical protein
MENPSFQHLIKQYRTLKYLNLGTKKSFYPAKY